MGRIRGSTGAAATIVWVAIALPGCSLLHEGEPTASAPSPVETAVDRNPVIEGENCTPSSTGEGGYPLPDLDGYANDCNTGPRHQCETTVEGPFLTKHDGQILDRLCIEGSLEIRHDDVIVRDVLIMGTGTYALDIGQDMDSCPANLRVEFTEVNMTNAGPTDWGIYQRCAGGHIFDHVKVMYAGRGVLSYGDVVFHASYVYSNRTKPEAHRTAFSTHGGDGFALTDSTFICVNTGCSSAVNIYSDFAPATDVLIEGNVLAGGSICLRGGQTHDYAEQTHDIRVINNRFSTLYAPECGTHQALAQFDEHAPGNLRSGNVWHESGAPLDG